MRLSVLLVAPLLFSIPMVVLLYMSLEFSFKTDNDHTFHLSSFVARPGSKRGQSFSFENAKAAALHVIVEKQAVKMTGRGVDDLMVRPSGGVLPRHVYRKGHAGQEIQIDSALGITIINGKNAFVTFPAFVDSPNKLGADGQAVVMNDSLLSAKEKEEYDYGWKHNSFNQYLSDRISVHRALPHGWSEECRKNVFRTDLPETSVIIIFHNEAWSVLLRSVHSVLSRTPPHLLREVILVDDFSTNGHLKEPLDEYWRRTDGRVKVLRAKTRGGLTKARLLGYHMSTAPMVVFFDSHIECFPGWFEPLADRLAADPNVTVFPNIEIISTDTLEVKLTHTVGSYGVFTWRDLTFQWAAIPKDQEGRSSADPIKSPTMPGGLFAINRDFFDRLGTYDPDLLYWGGENMELSFKAWMCYGSVELVPCSHVGHIFRRSNPITWHKDLGMYNVARVASVWMDGFSNYFLERNLYHIADIGDVADRKKMRDRLQCRDFAWYLKNLRPASIPPLHIQHAGELRLTVNNLCIDSYAQDSSVKGPKLYSCHKMGGNQFWYITNGGKLHQDEDQLVCEQDREITLGKVCSHTWNVTKHKQIIHSNLALCLQGGSKNVPRDQPDHSLTLQPCELHNTFQRWSITPRRNHITFPTID